MQSEFPLSRQFFCIALTFLVLGLCHCEFTKTVESYSAHQPKRILTYSSASDTDFNHLKREQTFYFNGNKELDAHYKRGILNGSYRSYWYNGQIQSQGEYHLGKKSGDWEYYYNRFSLSSKGKYENGNKQGLWIEYWENGSPKAQGKYRNDSEIGEWKSWNDKGDIQWVNTCFAANAQGFYKAYYGAKSLKEEYACEKGKSRGPYTKWFSDGTPMLRGYYNAKGQKDSLWEAFALNANNQSKGPLKIRQEFYRDGFREDSLYVWDIHGKLREQGFFKRGKGLLMVYDSLGFKQEIRQYVEDSLDGQCTGFFPNGKLKSQVFYQKGKAIRLKTWHANGQLSMQGDFIAGKKNGLWKAFTDKGLLLENLLYDNGVLDGPAYYYDAKNGALLRKQIYFRGYPKVGEWHSQK